MTPFLTFSTIFLTLFGAALCLDPELAGLKQVRSQVRTLKLLSSNIFSGSPGVAAWRQDTDQPLPHWPAQGLRVARGPGPADHTGHEAASGARPLAASEVHWLAQPDLRPGRGGGQEHRCGQDPDVRPLQLGWAVPASRVPGVGRGACLAANTRAHRASGRGLPPLQPLPLSQVALSRHVSIISVIGFRFEERQKEIQSGEWMKEIYASNRELFEYISLHTGDTITDIVK